MGDSYSAFADSINELRDDVQYQQNVQMLISAGRATFTDDRFQTLWSGLRPKIPAIRSYVYKANIINLYGLLENFIEASIEEYISKLNEVEKKFSSNSDKLLNEYLEKLIKLHGKLSYPKYKHLSDNTLINNAHKNFINDENSLLAECFFQNGGNYKHEIICESFSSLGLDGISTELGKYKPLEDYFAAQLITDVTNHDIYNTLDDLVERRNEVAHGSTSTLLSPDIFLDYLDFVSKYCESLTHYLDASLLGKVWALSDEPQWMITHVWHNTIVEINADEVAIEVGDQLICKSPSIRPKYFVVKVVDIHDSTGNAVDSVLISGALSSFSLKLSHPVTSHCCLKWWKGKK